MAQYSAKIHWERKSHEAFTATAIAARTRGRSMAGRSSMHHLPRTSSESRYPIHEPWILRRR